MSTVHPRFTGAAFEAAHGDDLATLRRRAGLTRAQACEWLGVHRITLRRWERGSHPAPASARRLLMVLAGAMPWPGWEAHQVRDGTLVNVDDERETYTPGELVRVRYCYALAAEARRVLVRWGMTPEQAQLTLALEVPP